MGDEVNIGPYTNFEEIFTYLRCPAKLYLQLAGYKSEVERRYSPPSISPAVLGREGERRIEQAFKRQLIVNVPGLSIERISLPKGKLEKALTRIRKIIASNIRIRLLQVRRVEAKYSPIILSEEAKKLKKDFKVSAIISKVDFTTIPHHRIGEIDFIGLKEDREAIIIEVKNKQAKINEKDRLQLEYYIDGLPKQYQYTKFYPHLYEIVSQLYPEKYREHVKIARSIDLLREEMGNSYGIVVDTIMGLNDAERKKFISMYPKSEEDVAKYENMVPSLAPEEAGLYYQVLGSSKKFLTTIPEYVKLEETFNTYSKKISSSTEEFKSAADLIVELMERGVKNGLLVDIRRSEVTEVNKTTNFDKVVKGVWQVKKSVFDGKKIAPKRTEACSRCNFRNTCKKVLKDEEPEECKSITSIVHKGFNNLNLEVSRPGFGTPSFDENGILRVNYVVPRVKTELSNEELLKRALSGLLM
ncbi:MAG: PD-(D/E)XK nuclease family protein [Candidatus Brockarchaeota archaeon]|nr:PD-(D/E)XK nuclease family protein [Candidatus Brockarchaeota archaeon]